MHTRFVQRKRMAFITLSDVIILHAYSIDRYFMAFREFKSKKKKWYNIIY